MQIDAAIRVVLFGVEVHEVSSSPSCVTCAQISIPRWYAEEGASISINRLQATANSVRSSLAPVVCRA
jgi:hypothetical protein